MALSDKVRAFLASIEDRLGLKESLSRHGQTRVPRQATVSVALSSAVLMLLAVEIITGIALASTYSPTTTDAWGSVFYIQEEVSWGHLVRAIHYHGASLLLIILVLQLVHMLFTASYRAPHEVDWYVSCFLLILVMGFGVTGYVLPWDQQGYWANQTELNLMDTVPGGTWIKLILAGGDTTGNLTLTRFYVLHVFILPAVVLLLLWLRRRTRKRHGYPASIREPSVPFWPNQAFWSSLVAFLALAAVFLLAVTVGVSLDAPADPGSAYEARPKWYFLWLFKLLQYFDGSAAIVVTVIFPMVCLLFLLVIPKLDADKPKAHRPAKRVWLPFTGLLILINALTAVALVEDQQNVSFQEFKQEANQEAQRAIEAAKVGGINAEGKVVHYEGLKLFKDKGCRSCHQKNASEKQGPLLAGYGSIDRIVRFLKEPDSPEFFGLTVFKESMDPFADYDGTDDDLQAVATWLYALSGRQVKNPALIGKGYAFFKASECVDCHNDPSTSFDYRSCAKDEECDHSKYRPGIEGPDLKGYQGYEWTRGVILDANHASFFGGVLDAKKAALSMPSYPDMSNNDVDLLTQWLLAGAPGAD